MLWITNVPSPYRVEFFNELGKQCDLTVLFEKHTSDERDKSWSEYCFTNFRGIILKGLSVSPDSAFCPSVVSWLKKDLYDEIVVMSFSTPTGILAVCHMRAQGIPYWIEGDGGFAKSGKGPKERLKYYLISGAKACLSTGKAHDEYFLTYGAEKRRIFRYPFTSLREKDLAKNPLSPEEKIQLRQKLGMYGNIVVLTVGQFIPRKGFDLLLTAAAAVPEADFYFVGGEATEEYLQIIKEKGLSHVHFVGFCSKETLRGYYQSSDIFVLPTREDIWGLVVNEAMANGLPVISTDRCGAALELVDNGENGFVVPTDDLEALTKAIKELLVNKQERSIMERKSLEKIRIYTIENMVSRHIGLWKEPKIPDRPHK